ncbi:uncharacterized protein LOC135366073 [Ornithodoros turicata]|uniref:uncharacterized protein LOC135366073 n=1 Tax=Ornithodoros turicata TaxID=34597 RepID=UPI00313956E6
MGSCSTYRSARELHVLPDCGENPVGNSSENFEDEYSVRVEVYDTEVTATSSTDSSPIIKISGLHTTGGVVRLCSSTHFLTGNIIPTLRQPLQCRALCVSNNRSLPNLRYHGKWHDLTPERISSPEILYKERKSSGTLAPELVNETETHHLHHADESSLRQQADMQRGHAPQKQRTSCRTFIVRRSFPRELSETVGVPKQPPIAPARKPKATANFRQHAVFEDKKAAAKCVCAEGAKEPQFSLFARNECSRNTWDKEDCPKKLFHTKVDRSYQCPHPCSLSCDRDVSISAFNFKHPCFSDQASCFPLQEVQNDCSSYFQSAEKRKNSQTDLNCIEEVVTTRVVPAASLHRLKCTNQRAHQNLESCCLTECSTIHGTARHRTKRRTTLHCDKVHRECRCKYHGHDTLGTCRRANVPQECSTRNVPIVGGRQRAKQTAHKATQTSPPEESVAPILTSLIEWLTITCQNFMSRFSNMAGAEFLHGENPLHITIGKSFQNLLANDASFWTNLVKQIHDGITGHTKQGAERRQCRGRPRKCTVPDSDVIVMAANVADNLRAEGMKGEGEHVTLKCCDPKQVFGQGQCPPKRTLSRVDLSTLRGGQASVGKVASNERVARRKYWSCLKF